MNGAELMVSALENEGVQQIFGIPGEENLDVVEALRRSRIKLVLTRHEQADHAYGMIRWKQAVDGFPDFGMTFCDPDFAAYARAYGAKGSRVESAEGLAPALEAAFMGGGVHLIMTPIDYSENERVLVDELRAQDATIGAGAA
jgi:thiamine pyrophosphate-dependent acetolactate synthase large subunit-like protein